MKRFHSALIVHPEEPPKWLPHATETAKTPREVRLEIETQVPDGWEVAMIVPTRVDKYTMLGGISDGWKPKRGRTEWMGR